MCIPVYSFSFQFTACNTTFYGAFFDFIAYLIWNSIILSSSLWPFISAHESGQSFISSVSFVKTREAPVKITKKIARLEGVTVCGSRLRSSNFFDSRGAAGFQHTYSAPCPGRLMGGFGVFLVFRLYVFSRDY